MFLSVFPTKFQNADKLASPTHTLALPTHAYDDF